MSIGERLGYLSVVETLRPVTAVAVPAPLATDEKYRVISPEIMQEAPMSDSEEEGGRFMHSIIQSPLAQLVHRQ